MSLTSLLESVSRRLQERHVNKWAQYKQLVADLCDGKEPDAEEVAQILADNNRTMNQLKHDAEHLAKRRKLRAEMDAILPLEAEAAKLETKIREGEKELEELQAKHQERMTPVYARRYEISIVRKRAAAAKDELRETCEDPEVLAAYDRFFTEYKEASRQCQQIEKEITQLRVWAVDDDRDGGRIERPNEKQPNADRIADYQERIARLEKALEPARARMASLQAQEAEFERRLVEP